MMHNHDADKHKAEHSTEHCGEHPMMTGGSAEGAASRESMNNERKSYGDVSAVMTNVPPMFKERRP